jgi:hypothetical protein
MTVHLFIIFLEYDKKFTISKLKAVCNYNFYKLNVNPKVFIFYGFRLNYINLIQFVCSKMTTRLHKPICFYFNRFNRWGPGKIWSANGLVNMGVIVWYARVQGRICGRRSEGHGMWYDPNSTRVLPKMLDSRSTDTLCSGHAAKLIRASLYDQGKLKNIVKTQQKCTIYYMFCLTIKQNLKYYSSNSGVYCSFPYKTFEFVK